MKPEKQVELFWAKVDKYMGFRKWDGYGWLARAIDGYFNHG
jgi:hypothetical protein